MAIIKYTGEEALGRVAEYVNKKLTFASSMPESPDTDTVVLYVGASNSSYLKGGIYQYDGTNWKIINLVQQIELTQEEYEELPDEAKNNGTVYFITNMNIPGSIISGYYNEIDGLFYEDYTFETKMAENINVLYIDLNTNTTYIYDINEDEYVQTGGGRDGFIQYVTALPPSDVKNIIYGCRTTILNQYITELGFLDSDTNFFDSDGRGGYYVNSEVKVKASTVEEEESYKDLNLITYNSTNEEFTLHYKDQTTQTLGMNELLFCKITYITYYAGDAENQNFIFLGSGSVEKILLNYYTKEEVNNLLDGIKPTTFNGRSGSILPIAGDYNDSQIILSSVMHIGGETQTTVAEALDALKDHSGSGIETPVSIENGGTGNSKGYIRTGQLSNFDSAYCATAEGASVIAKGRYSHAEGGGGNFTVNKEYWGRYYYSLAEIESLRVLQTVDMYYFSIEDLSISMQPTTVTTNIYAKILEPCEYLKANDTVIVSLVRDGNECGQLEILCRDSRSFSIRFNNFTLESSELSSITLYADAYNILTTGDSLITIGDCSHAEGRLTKTFGDYSHAGGVSTIATYEAQTTIGKYNDNKSTTLLEVGNGTSSTRSNALEVHDDGTIGATSGLGIKLKSDNTKAIKFGIDSNGNYGYYKDGADTVTPFKTGTETTDATATQSEILNGKTAYIASGKVTGNMTNRGAVSATIDPGGSYTIPAGYHNGSGTVTANNANLQTKTVNVKPSANYSGTNTNNATINPDSGYAGMSQVNVNVPMLRDHTLLTASSVETPSTVYNGDTSQSNSTKMLRLKPTKDGMSYTGSYLNLGPSSYMGNATVADVVSGKTFSSTNGIQITGTATLGTDTSDATATASDILSGKTAYVKGNKITGNMTIDTESGVVVGYLMKDAQENWQTATINLKFEPKKIIIFPLNAALSYYDKSGNNKFTDQSILVYDAEANPNKPLRYHFYDWDQSTILSGYNYINSTNIPSGILITAISSTGFTVKWKNGHKMFIAIKEGYDTISIT